MISFNLIHLLFLVIFLYDSYYFVIFLYQSFRKRTVQYSPLISVIVPVYNGESTIEKCIQSILDSDYSIKEVIVINDGSTDRTADILNSLTGTIVYYIPHSGKAAALNHGIQHASTDIVTMDADTVVQKDTIKKLVQNLKIYDAVAGNVQVSNRTGFLGRCQAVEHIRAAMFKKVAQYFDDIDIVPGPLGAFKKKIFSHLQYGTSLVEDMELTQKLREHNFTIGYEQEAVAYTEMPATWTSFLRQRFRWAKGNLELLLKREIPFTKVLPGYFTAFADLLLVVLCLWSHNFLLLGLFFLFESFTMFIGNLREKTHYYVESALFPVFMLFLDGVYLLSHSTGFISILSNSNTP
ncbi:MAG: glycosyltransferase family 2 protein [Theionarchaea archaeon]|nr:glycosyltransferase family 2 protein [Theionarchaea archaeon]